MHSLWKLWKQNNTIDYLLDKEHKHIPHYYELVVLGNFSMSLRGEFTNKLSRGVIILGLGSIEHLGNLFIFNYS